MDLCEKRTLEIKTRTKGPNAYKQSSLLFLISSSKDKGNEGIVSPHECLKAAP